MASSFYVIPLAYLACIRAILNYKEIYGTSRLSDSMALNIYVPVGPCLLDASKFHINTFECKFKIKFGILLQVCF